MTEFNLSDKIVDTIGTPHDGRLYTEDVKEFIRLLKDRSSEANCGGGCCNAGYEIMIIIDKLAGDSLK